MSIFIILIMIIIIRMADFLTEGSSRNYAFLSTGLNVSAKAISAVYETFLDSM